MNKMIEWFARNTVAANLLMVGIFLSGIVGYTQMEREMFPTIGVNYLGIDVSWPGASPTEMEEQVIVRVEESISDLDNIDRIMGRIGQGYGNVTLEVNPKADFYQVLNDVRQRVDGIAGLPRDIEPPRVTQYFARNEMFRIAVHGDLNEQERSRLAEVLRREVAELPAVSIVELFGVRREEVSVELSDTAMQRYRLTFTDVADAIRENSMNVSAGTIRSEAGDLGLRVSNLADNSEDFGNIIIRQTADGGTIYLRDVATIIDGFEDQPILATMNGDPAVLLQVMTSERNDVVKASNSIKDWITEREPTLPKGAKLTVWQDNAIPYQGRMDTISNSAIYGLILVLVILLLSLRPKVAVWVSIGIATAYAGAFILLPSAGISLNMLSTFAFLLVLGIVVDDAIVVGESIHSESQKTGGGLTAAVLGTQLVAKPVIFAVLTTIIAFMPWLFLTGPQTEFTRQITMVVVTALSFSLIESLLILPAHLNNMKPRENMGRFSQFQKRIADSIIMVAHRYYRPIGQWAVRRRYLTFAIFISVLIVGFGGVMGNFVKFSFDPEIEGDQVYVNIALPDGTPYSRAEEILAHVQTAQVALNEEMNAELGEGKKLIENWYTRSRRDSVIAILALASPDDRNNISSKTIALRLNELIGEIPDAQSVTVNYQLDDNDSPGFELSVRHTDLEVLRQASHELKEKLRTYDAVRVAYDDLQTAGEEIRLSLKPGTEKLGLTLNDVTSQVRQAYYGLEVQRLPRSGQDVRVMVRYPKDERYNIDSLSTFRIRTNDGREVPLMAITDMEYAPGIKEIRRYNRRRSARISAQLTGEQRDDITKDLEESFYPDWVEKYPGLQHGPIGQAEGQAEFLAEITGLYIMALFIMYATLAIAFRSYYQPMLIMVAMPFAVVGAIFGHMVTGTAMNIFSYFGVAAAIGVVVNDNLVLVDYCNRLRERGMPALDAMVEAGVVRFRPILLTTITTMIGLTPMMMEKSIQAAFLQPIVIALVFGVFIAFFITLMLVPSMYAIGDDFSRWAGIAKQAVKRFIVEKLLRRPGRPSPTQAE